VANNVVAPIGDQGNVCFYASQNTDITVDVSGYFTGESDNQFVGAAPKRFVDTRSSLGPVPQKHATKKTIKKFYRSMRFVPT
jgi:hypothetical protein